MSLNSMMTSSGAMLFGIAIASLAIAQPAPESIHVNNRAAFKTLEGTFLKVGSAEVKFSEVLKTLQDELGLVFVLDPSTQDYELDGETVISFAHSQESRVATALETILREYYCTWCIQDGVVRIISVDCAMELEYLNLMTFECGDLVEKIRPVTTVTPPAHRHMPGGLFTIPPRWNPPTNGPNQEETDKIENREITPVENGRRDVLVKRTIQPIDQLKNLIQETVDPDSWNVNGGMGSVIAVNNVLVVRQTQFNLRQINSLLATLRDTNLSN